jgi:hypothetical protein
LTKPLGGTVFKHHVWDLLWHTSTWQWLPLRGVLTSGVVPVPMNAWTKADANEDILRALPLVSHDVLLTSLLTSIC